MSHALIAASDALAQHSNGQLRALVIAEVRADASHQPASNPFNRACVVTSVILAAFPLPIFASAATLPATVRAACDPGFNYLVPASKHAVSSSDHALTFTRY